jgi:hypothetical protein
MLFDNIVYEYPHRDRVVIIGDIHGDLKRFKNILIDAKIINNAIEWIAEPQNTIVVQLGDQVDSLNRSPFVPEWEVLDDTEILKFTNFLDNIAKTKGGRIISLIGNHEFMNTIGNYSYVSAKSLESTERRTELFKPKGSLASLLAYRPIVLKIGELFFCHAGLKKHHLDVLEKYNKHISYLNIIWKNYMLHGQVLHEDKEIFDKIILDFDGILWTREFDNLDIVTQNLHKLGCTFMFVGHTTVDSVKCLGGLVWYVDTGISRAYGSSSYQYIDMSDYKINVKQIQEQ